MHWVHEHRIGFLNVERLSWLTLFHWESWIVPNWFPELSSCAHCSSSERQLSLGCACRHSKITNFTEEVFFKMAAIWVGAIRSATMVLPICFFHGQKLLNQDNRAKSFYFLSVFCKHICYFGGWFAQAALALEHFYLSRDTNMLCQSSLCVAFSLWHQSVVWLRRRGATDDSFFNEKSFC